MNLCVNLPRRCLIELCLFVCVINITNSEAKTYSPFSFERMLLPFAFVQDDKEIRTLTQGQTLERELSSGQSHSYKIKVAANQYLKIIVEQKGIDVVVEVYLPDGKKLFEVDSPNGTQGPESLELITPIDGVYSLKVRSLEEKASAGRYEIKFVELRTATEQDKKRNKAQQAFAEAERLRVQGTAVSLRNAIEKYKEALQLWRETDSHAEQSNVLNNLAIAHSMLGEIKESIECLNQALPLVRATNNRNGEGAILANLGYMYGLVGEPQKAIESLTLALPVLQAIGNREGVGATLNNIGLIYDSLGEKQKALVYYNQTLPIARELGNRSVEAITISNIGKIHRDLGEPQKSIEYFKQALQIQQEIKDKQGETVTLNNLATTFGEIGETQMALDNFARAFEISKITGDRATEAAMLINLGATYSGLGERLKALDYYNQTLLVLRDVGDKHGESLTRINMGKVLSDLGKNQEALNYYNQALPVTREIGDRFLEATALNNIGGVYADWNERQKALDYFNQALALFRTTGNRREEANTLNNIGDTYYKSGDKQKALEYYNRALPLRRESEDRHREPLTLFAIARVERDLGNFAEAQNKIEESLKIIESLRAKIGSQQLRASYFASYQKSYEFYTDLLMRLHKSRPSAGFDAIALQANERARARGLLELLSEANVNIRQGVDEKLLERERELQQKISKRTDDRVRLLNTKHTKEQVETINKEIKELTGEYEKIEAQIRTTSPRYAALSQPQPITLTDIQTKVLDKDTILLEYALGDERSYLWIVTQDSINSCELPKGAEIKKSSETFLKLISSRPTAATKKDYMTAAQALSDILLKPVANHLQNNKRLLIVGDGILQYIPFAALPVSGQWSVVSGQKGVTKPKGKATDNGQRTTDNKPLIVEHEIISLPSASTIAVLRDEKNVRPKNAKEIMVVADPVFESSDLRVKRDSQTNSETKKVSADTNKDRALQSFLRTLNNETNVESAQPIPRLSYTRREALTIAALVPQTQSKIYLDFDANYANAANADAGQYRFIHFATHGLLNSEQPELTGILFSMIDEKGNPQPQSLLRLGEVYNLKLPVELVVLSGCQTAIGKEIKGEGLIGLTRGFMYAGSPRVVASLWKVDDAMTAEVVKHFYQAMLGAKRLAPAAALRQAQKEMLRQKIEPFYWAAFIMQGEWR
jgi:CHAT domain-containing protein/Tfp pilus assembly protein PilF